MVRPVTVDLTPFQTDDYLTNKLVAGDTPQAIHQLLHELRLARDRIKDDIGRVLVRHVTILGTVLSSGVVKEPCTVVDAVHNNIVSETNAVDSVTATATALNPVWLEREDEVRRRLGRGEWEEAILLLDKLGSEKEKLRDEVANALLKMVKLPLISKAELVRTVQWLMLLGKGEQAREHFLAARSQAIREGHCLIQYAGRVSRIVSDLAFITMHGLHTTAEWYRTAFANEPILMAGLIIWAQLELGKLVTLVSKLLFQSKPKDNDDEVAIAIHSMRTHIGHLSSIGMDLTVPLDDLIRQHLERLIQQHVSELERQLE